MPDSPYLSDNRISLFVYHGRCNSEVYCIDQMELLIIHADQLSATYLPLLFGNPEVHSVSVLDEINEAGEPLHTTPPAWGHRDATHSRRVVDNPLNEHKQCVTQEVANEMKLNFK